MLHRRNAKPTAREINHQFFNQRGFAGVFEPGDADDFLLHAAPRICSAIRKSSGAFTLKKGS